MHSGSHLVFSLIMVGLLTGCSAGGPTTPTTPAGTPISAELLLSRGSLSGTTFEQYKVERGRLFCECGVVARGRYAAEEQELTPLTETASAEIANQVAAFQPLFDGITPQLDPPGKSNGVFDPGQAVLVVSDGSTTRELRTSLDAVANGQGSYPDRMLKLARSLRRNCPKDPCGNASFFGIPR